MHDPSPNRHSADGPSATRLWTLDFTVTVLGIFSFFGSFFFLLSALPDYIESIGGEEWQIGLIVGGFSILPLLVWPLVGRWSDRGHRVRLMYLALVITAVSLLLQAFSEDVWSLFALRVVQGLGMVAFPTAGASIIGVIAPVHRRGEGIGYYGFSTSASQMAFPALGVLIADTWGFDAVFFISAATAAGTILLMVPLREPPTQVVVERAERPVLLPRRALFPMAVFFTVTFSFTALAAFLPDLGDERGFGNVGLYFLVSGAFAMVVRPLAGTVSDRYGRSTMVVPGLVLLAGGMALLAAADSQLIMFVAGAINGVGFGTVHTGLFALAFDRVPPTQRGGAAAVFRSAWDSGGLAGGVVLGLVASAIDVESTFWISAALLAGAVFLYMGGRSAGLTQPYGERSDGGDEVSTEEERGSGGAGDPGTVPVGTSGD